MKLLSRHLSSELQEALAISRVVNLIGPRQVGKTTLVKDLLQQGKFITLDNTQTLEAIEADTFAQLSKLTEDIKKYPLIIDEAQRSRQLSLAIKQIVDTNQKKGQFLLTGSSNIFVTTQVSDSLVGRIMNIKLWPLTVSEIKNKPVPRILDWAMQKNPNLTQLKIPEGVRRADYIDLILKGGFPEIRNLPIKNRQKRYRDYVDGVVDRDVATISIIRKPDALRRLVDQLSARTATEINISNLCNNLSLKRETVDQYLDILTRLSLVIKLGAWAYGESRREIKSPKYHFVDSGVACALRRLTDQTFELIEAPALGGILESFICNEILRILPMQAEEFRLYHWRSPDKKEIDLLVDGGDRLTAIEVKSASTVGLKDFKHIDWFTNKGPGQQRQITGVVFYLGNEPLSFGKRRFALPVSSLWGEVHL